ncbi:GAF domain-containing protein [Zoogloea sp. LCSB751]|uniref:GAF domain-containing protein n=1 Tax=Zoogloea sp. LCSB751 TaxID=1965277 RepID=UPI0009A52160
MTVTDARQDERFWDNPLVIGPPLIRFYAGAPLKVSSGHNLGILCLIDPMPKSLAPEEVEHLQVLARMVSQKLEKAGPVTP